MILFEIPQIKKLEYNRLFLIIGSLLPDIIDKTLLLLKIGDGRFFSHTLLFAFGSFILLHLLTQRNIKKSLPYFIGVISHLLLDLPYLPLFYPFIPYNWGDIHEPFSIWFETLLTNPVVQITEFIGLSILIYVMINNKLYHLKDMIYYLNGKTINSLIKLNEIDNIFSYKQNVD